MDALLYLLPALGCGLMIVVTMVFVRGGMAAQRTDGADDSRSDEDGTLRHEVDRPRSESSDPTRVDA